MCKYFGGEQYQKNDSKDIKSMSAKAIAYVLCHYPLNRLINKIRNEHIDGNNLIVMSYVIKSETEWNEDVIMHIELFLSRYNCTFTDTQFINNFDIFENFEGFLFYFSFFFPFSFFFFFSLLIFSSLSSFPFF
eukprot:134789_1